MISLLMTVSPLLAEAGIMAASIPVDGIPVKPVGDGQTFMIIAQVLTFLGTMSMTVVSYLMRKDSKERESTRIEAENKFKIEQQRIASQEKIELARIASAQLRGVQNHVTEKMKEVKEVVEKSKEERSQQMEKVIETVEALKPSLPSSSSEQL